jgi:hypothetical protein
MTYPTYDIATETGNGYVNSVQLGNEILASALPQGVKDTFDGINTADTNEDGVQDTMTVLFTSVPSGADQTTIDGIVAAHNGVVTTGKTQEAVLWAEDTTAGGWKNRLTLNSQPLLQGSWIVFVRADLALTTGANFDGGSPVNYPQDAVAARVTVDTGSGPVERINWLSPWLDYETKQVSDLLLFQEGDAPVIALDYRLLGVGDTARIRRCRIILQPSPGTVGGGE